MRPADAPDPRRIASRAMRHGATILLLVCTLALPCAPASGQRDFQRPIGETVADRGSPHYRFETFVHASGNGERRWRVRVGIPAQAAPEQARPSIWMLDGNAALSLFDETILAELAESNAPVLVFLGHDNDMRVDTAQRWRDYTPTMTPPGQPRRHPDGGGDAFLEAIERGIRPKVAHVAVLDPDRQLLWGHSLGGLFVLHALFQRPGLFQTHVAASPSLWWQGGQPLAAAERFAAHYGGESARLWIMLGSDETGQQARTADSGNPRAAAYLAMVSSAGPDAAARLAGRLAAVPGLDVRYREFPELGHGPALRASLMATLQAVSGIGDRVIPTPAPASGDPP